MIRNQYPYFLANRPLMPNHDLSVRHKFTGEEVAAVALADPPAFYSAITKAEEAVPAMRDMPVCERRRILKFCVERFRDRADELAKVVCLEVGKTINEAKFEVERFIDTFELAAEEASRVVGEVVPLDLSPRNIGYRGQWRRVPIGPCSFITPFNFPLNLLAHKVAPALAVGCPFVLKPASLTPVSALIVGEVLAETGLPNGAFSILPCRRDAADLLITDDRIKLLSFTGSSGSGWDMKRRAGRKRVLLELGGNAGVIVDEDADLRDAANRISAGAFGQAGQSCISVQRAFIHEAVYDELKALLVERATKLKVGDPENTDTVVGPLISEAEAERVDSWIQVAVARGGKLVCGGKREKALMWPTLLEDVPPDERIVSQEVFGPVAALTKVRSFEEAVEMVNASNFGLQAGVFTRDIYKVHYAWDKLEVGGVIVGDVPTWRADHMPYGGIKDSGVGREGVRFSMEEMTEIRMLAVRTLPTS